MLKNKKFKYIFSLLTIYIGYILLISILYYNKLLSSYMISSINLIFAFSSVYIILKKLNPKKTLNILILVIFILFLLNLIFIRVFNSKTIIYYLLIILSFILSKNKKEKKKKL